jgi:hypothetical protein
LKVLPKIAVPILSGGSVVVMVVMVVAVVAA